MCHEADYQTNLVDGKFKDSNFGELVRKVLETKKFGFADFEPYAPSNDVRPRLSPNRCSIAGGKSTPS